MADYDDGTPKVVQNSFVLTTQLVIAGSLGISACLVFCVVRTQWPQVYAARASRLHNNIPPLPNTFFGWIPALYSITDEQVLEHAGLDAFVFLEFFRMAIKLLAIWAFLSAAVISPIRLYFTGIYDQDSVISISRRASLNASKNEETTDPEDYNVYLWCYVAFAYIFTFITGLLLFKRTRHIGRVRQSYLGSQNSITDRTILLSGIPPDLRTEGALKEHIEGLGIGEVRSITICRRWTQLDRLMDRRRTTLHQVERAWTEYLHGKVKKRPIKPNPVANAVALSIHISVGSDGEVSTPLLETSRNSATLDNSDDSVANGSYGGRQRPLIRTGLLKYLGIGGKLVDKIDYYTSKLQKIDEQVRIARSKEFSATGDAFVTMDSVASAQMAAQAVLDPRVYRLIAHSAPAPHDVIWQNLYKSRISRFCQSWFITSIIAFATLAFIFPVASLAAFLNTKTILKFWPGLGNALMDSPLLSALVTGFFPTVAFTILNSIAPSLYNGISNLQGYISHGDVELSVVAKNFFYVFFNMFIVFTAAGTAINYRALLMNSAEIAYTLARALRYLSSFYINVIILQGIGMIPFRLLEFGVVIRYPFLKVLCKTPREFYHLYKPPSFNYGLYLPQPILVLIICLCYSCMSTKILCFGLIYFILGYFTFKYQLLYSMSHTQHSTGKSWPMIFFRVCIGLLLFQLTMAGSLGLQGAYFLSSLLAPLPIITIILMYNFYDHHLKLSYFIALRSIKHGQLRRFNSRTLDEERELNHVYINPNLICPLEEPCVLDRTGKPVDVYFDADSSQYIFKPRTRRGFDEIF
ncbi:hypothetical protein POJ06DRAFT_54098 [Lipomyces tetrasporus]|uniref:DUF221-domain-containing protein n=1 Tax=Lipomyces tetrasporus TaxID=54092 RepID=A0AAD7QWQ8_9ASCO|nr:uncharacterized protein POJ06DRAFT_54098 [Lipomyces tetrasporus]KAJ8102705.1 hypothetical protein POJ06DRAFT_54098 [Lipomyces tetrasporus]